MSASWSSRPRVIGTNQRRKLRNLLLASVILLGIAGCTRKSAAAIAVYPLEYLGPKVAQIVPVSPGRAFFVGSTGAFGFVDMTSDGRLREIASPYRRERVRSASIDSHGRLWVVTNDGSSIYAIESVDERLRLTAKIRLPAAIGAVDHLVAAPDGSFWFFIPELQQIARIDQNGRMTNKVRLEDDIESMLLAKNGDLVISDYNGLIQRIDKSQRRFTLRRDVPAAALTSDKVGNIWFVNGPNSIGRISRLGALSHIGIDPKFHAVEEIAVGLNVAWLAEDGGVIHSNLSGQRSQFIGVSGFLGAPSVLAIASDGTVWGAGQRSCWSVCSEAFNIRI